MKRNRALGLVVLVLMAVLLFLLKQCNRSSNENKHLSSSRSSKAKQQQDRGLNRNTSILYYSKHAKCRMQCRNISQKEVEQILETGMINYNKSDLHGNRGPEYAVEGLTSDGQRVRIIFAPKNTQITVVTV